MHRATNNVEQDHAFEDWGCFARGGTSYETSSEEQEKHVKYTSLLATCVIVDHTIEISAALNALAKEGCIPTLAELAALAPYQTRHIKRFGK